MGIVISWQSERIWLATVGIGLIYTQLFRTFGFGMCFCPNLRLLIWGTIHTLYWSEVSVNLCLCCVFSLFTKILESFNCSSQRTSAFVDLCLHCAFSNKFLNVLGSPSLPAVTPDLLIMRRFGYFQEVCHNCFYMNGGAWILPVALLWYDLICWVCYNECVAMVWFGFPKCVTMCL